MLARFDPFRDFDRAFERTWDTARQPSMPLDAYRHGDTYVINIDLPGVDPDHIEVKAERQVLTVSAQRRWTPVEGDVVVAAERPQGTFTRQLFLGEGLDGENIHATYDHGVLMITVPMSDRAKPRKIAVQRADSAQELETHAN